MKTEKIERCRQLDDVVLAQRQGRAVEHRKIESLTAVSEEV